MGIVKTSYCLEVECGPSATPDQMEAVRYVFHEHAKEIIGRLAFLQGNVNGHNVQSVTVRLMVDPVVNRSTPWPYKLDQQYPVEFSEKADEDDGLKLVLGIV